MATRADRFCGRRRRCARDAALRHPAGACGIAHGRGLARRRCGGGWALRRRLDAHLGRRRRLVVGLRLFRRRTVVARLGVPRRSRSVRLGPAVRRARAAGAARGLFRPRFCSFASLMVPRRRAALRFRLRPDGLGMAARHSLHRVPVEHDRHGARPEPLADAGGLGDRALRPDDPRHPDLRGAGDARDRRRRIAPLGGAWPLPFRPSRSSPRSEPGACRAPRRRRSPG